MKIALVIFSLFLVIGGGYLYRQGFTKQVVQQITDQLETHDNNNLVSEPHTLSIEYLRKGNYPGSQIQVEQTLTSGANYQRLLVSYQSEGLKIYALLTVPDEVKPLGGFPVVVFNHGFIPPQEYKTTERYIAYTDAFSSNGYILLRPDYRGHGDSDGQASGGYGSNGYTIDVLNAVASIKQYPGVNPDKIGMWGHSMGGYITLRNMVVRSDVKAGVIWGGVVASYPDLLNSWRRRTTSASPLPSGIRQSWRQALVEQFGEPQENPQFWNSISANSYLPEISGPLQLHHGSADTSVPLEFSQKLTEQLQAVNKIVEFYTYPEDDHNLSSNLDLALQRSVDFFDRYLK